MLKPYFRILQDLRNTPSYSLRASLSKILTYEGNSSKSINTSIFKTKSSIANSTNCLPLKICSERIKNSIDLLAAKAEKHFYNCEYNKCLKILDE